MKKIHILALLAIGFQALSAQHKTESGQSYAGIWYGVMQVSEQMRLQLAFEITELDAGAYKATFNVIEQNAFDIPMDTCIIVNDSVQIHFQAAGISYEGYYSRGGDKIVGTYEQGGGRFILNLQRVDELVREVERPQTPVRPFPYREEDVKFENRAAGILLAGTLTLPSEGTDFPSVVLIAGSGRNDRNETAMGHFLLLSDFLTRNGYAVLRYDKRGVGESEGDYGQATTFDFAEDVKYAMDFLASHEDIDSSMIGLIGHSEGGLIAPIIASENGKAAFIVMMGGMGIQGKELLLLQSAKMAGLLGMPQEQIDAITETNRTLYEIAMEEDNETSRVQMLREADPDIDDNLLNMLSWNWFRTFLTLDPDAYLSKIDCPVLGVTGEKDIQCPPGENLAAMERSLQKAGNTHYELHTMEGLNHLFQTAETGSPYEYEQIAEIISPDTLQLILEWMDKVAK